MAQTKCFKCGKVHKFPRVRCFLCQVLHSRESTHFVGWTVVGWIAPRKVRLYQCNPCWKDMGHELNTFKGPAANRYLRRNK